MAFGNLRMALGLIRRVLGGGASASGEKRLACILALDTSGSMLQKKAIFRLEEGLVSFREQAMASGVGDRIDAAVISFGRNVKVEQDFVRLSSLPALPLVADGPTPMGKALHLAMDMAKEQTAHYEKAGIAGYSPWIFCITDGEPTDEYASAAARLKGMEAADEALAYCVGAGDFHREKMADIFDEERIYELKNLNFASLFKFLTDSIATAIMKNSSRAAPAELPPDVEQVRIMRRKK
jgi:uncharacterized protein YegL